MSHSFDLMVAVRTGSISETRPSGLDVSAGSSGVLRPPNHRRMAFHVLSGLLTLLMVELVFSPTSMVLTALGFALFSWTCETTRRMSPAINELLMKVFGPVAHPHEHVRVNSATWYTTALLIVAVTCPMEACAVGLVILALGDPAAALVGRRYGRTRLANGRSLEGSLAFLSVGTLAAFVVLFFGHALPGPTALVVALGAAMVGAVAELVVSWLDDNLVIPIGAAFAATGLLALVG